MHFIGYLYSKGDSTRIGCLNSDSKSVLGLVSIVTFIKLQDLRRFKCFINRKPIFFKTNSKSNLY